MTQDRQVEWLRLDNAGKIFPATSDKLDTGVFRISCELKEYVDPGCLQRALDAALRRFPYFLFVLRVGLFWYYLERGDFSPRVHEEDRPVCAPLYNRGKKTPLFDISYYGRKINLEVFHALTDGAGAFEFMRTILYYYVTYRHPAQFQDEPPMLDYDASTSHRKEDSFRRYGEKGKSMKFRNPRKAYWLRGTRPKPYRYRVIEGIASCSELLKIAKERGTTLTVLLSAYLMQAIYMDMPVRKRKYPVVLNVPVNLRKEFPSATARNFFSNAFTQYDFKNGPADLDSIIAKVAADFRAELSGARLSERLNNQLALERNLLLRIAPLPLKNFAMRLARNSAKKSETMVLSNVGRFPFDEKLSPFIELVDVFAGTPHMHLSICSYGDRLAMSFTSMMTETDIQRNFFRLLTAQGLEVEIRSN